MYFIHSVMCDFVTSTHSHVFIVIVWGDVHLATHLV